jgi:hypothetical protein
MVRWWPPWSRARPSVRSPRQADTHWAPPARWTGGMPSSRGSGLFVNKYSRRGPQEGPEKIFSTFRPLDGREVSGPTPPARWSGGRYPFLEIFQIGTPFSNLIIFLTSFLKKFSKGSFVDEAGPPLSRLVLFLFFTPRPYVFIHVSILRIGCVFHSIYFYSFL